MSFSRLAPWSALIFSLAFLPALGAVNVQIQEPGPDAFDYSTGELTLTAEVDFNNKLIATVSDYNYICTA